MGYTLVTGATSDIGKQICMALAAEGHKILLSDLSEEALIETCADLGEGEHRIIPLDLSNVEESRERLTSFMKENDIAVSNAVFAAGIFSIKPLKLIDYSFVKKNFDIGVFSILFLSQALASKKFNGDNLKNIVMVSSISAIVGTKGYTTYSAVKASMLGILKSLATELAPKTRVNAILPGGVRTRTTNFIYEGLGDAIPGYLLGEGQPSDIANAVSFLMSEKSRWITGQEIIVDGGFTATH